MKLCKSVLSVVVCVTLVSSCVSKLDRPPERDGYVVQAYHFCEKCESLQGGIYEKGPFKKFSSDQRKECVHEWQEISRDRFMQLAVDLHAVDWSKEPGHFWNGGIQVEQED
ncbi:hypothetical protein Pan241w_37040 [Gimesia alba]|uniref:Lipoprotein n=1 Tax=Gimesia alba TaxID=2527973 RepID=A0A517RIA9_9PLAN|nr:hypothetical protein [Gimesia alba]QDT43602.1 hypothetical protein Pan241w_37040 [Gimesia alba]